MDIYDETRKFVNEIIIFFLLVIIAIEVDVQEKLIFGMIAIFVVNIFVYFSRIIKD